MKSSNKQEHTYNAKMSRVSIVIISSLLIILPTIFAAPTEPETTNEEIIPMRDEWWKFQNEYTDMPRVFDLDDDDKCPVDADEFYLDCNRCSCKDGALGGCGRMGCAIPQIANWEDGKACPSEQKFYFKCNDCDCHADGKSATCTEKACPEPTSS